MQKQPTNQLRLFLVALVLLLIGNLAYAEDLSAANMAPPSYQNAAYGFTFDANGFAIDNSNAAVKTVFFNDQTIVDIFYDDFSGTVHSAIGYLDYSNRGFYRNNHIQLESDQYIDYLGHTARIIKWQRPPLKYVKDNYLYHALIDIVKNESEVYSIQISSHQPIEPLDYLNRFNMIDKVPNQVLNEQPIRRLENPYWSIETKAFYNRVFNQSTQTQMGIFEPSTPYSMRILSNFEKHNQLRFDYLLEYYSLASYFNNAHFKELYDDGRILELTFQTSLGNNFSSDYVYDVLNGRYDLKLKQLAESINGIEGPVLFRFNNEMNGDWCSYNALHYERDSRLFIALWKHIYKLITENGGQNAIFVFNPNEKSFPDFSWNHYTNYFPGAEYVDVIGVTGYNTGNYYNGESWREFKDIYDAFMPDYQRRFLGYKFYITEFGSSVYGGDRAEWFRKMFENINQYGFKLAIYWNGIDWDSSMQKARIYRFFEDKSAIEQFKMYYNQTKIKGPY